MIPWKRFWLEYGDMWTVLALERLNMMDAMLLANTIGHSKKGDPKVTELLERHMNEAFPKD